MNTVSLKTVARTGHTVMRRVIVLNKPTNTYVFIDLTGRTKHSIVTPDTTDLLSDCRIEHFDSLPDLATALRDRFELTF